MNNIEVKVGRSWTQFGRSLDIEIRATARFWAYGRSFSQKGF